MRAEIDTYVNRADQLVDGIRNNEGVEASLERHSGVPFRVLGSVLEVVGHGFDLLELVNSKFIDVRRHVEGLTLELGLSKCGLFFPVTGR